MRISGIWRAVATWEQQDRLVYCKPFVSIEFFGPMANFFDIEGFEIFTGAADFVRPGLRRFGEFRIQTVSFGHLLNCNDANLLFGNKDHPDFKRAAISKHHGEKTLEPGLMNMLQTGESEFMSTIDMVNDRRLDGHNSMSLAELEKPATLKY